MSIGKGLSLVLALAVAACGGAQATPRASADAPAGAAPATDAPAAEAESTGTTDESAWVRQVLGNFDIVSVETPAPLVEDYTWVGDYLGMGRLFAVEVGGTRYGVRASRITNHGAEYVRRAMEARTAAGCSVEETQLPATLEGSPAAPVAVTQWTLECEGVVARIRHYGFESETCPPGHGVSLVVVGADEETAARFFESLRSEASRTC